MNTTAAWAANVNNLKFPVNLPIDLSQYQQARVLTEGLQSTNLIIQQTAAEASLLQNNIIRATTPAEHSENRRALQSLNETSQAIHTQLKQVMNASFSQCEDIPLFKDSILNNPQSQVVDTDSHNVTLDNNLGNNCANVFKIPVLGQSQDPFLQPFMQVAKDDPGIVSIISTKVDDCNITMEAVTPVHNGIVSQTQVDSGIVSQTSVITDKSSQELFKTPSLPPRALFTNPHTETENIHEITPGLPLSQRGLVPTQALHTHIP